MLFREADQCRDIFGRKVSLAEHVQVRYFRRFVRRFEGVKQGQGHFPFADVVAAGLADGGVIEVVENVVAYLETIAEQPPEFPASALYLRGCFRRDRTDLGTCLLYTSDAADEL